MIYQTAKILVITRQNISQARKPVLSEKEVSFYQKTLIFIIISVVLNECSNLFPPYCYKVLIKET